jgi:hypothetical protein
LRRSGFFGRYASVFKGLVFALVLIFLSSATGLAVPIESIAEPEIPGCCQVAAAPAVDPPMVKIPDSPVHMFLREGSNSRFELFFLDVKYGWDLVDFEFYKAWCLSKNKPLRRNTIHRIRLYNYYSPDLPSELRGTRWNQINYVINHKQGPKEAVQQAIWYFTDGEKQAKPSAEAARLIEEAELKGKDYIPGQDELIAVVCVPEKEKQPVFIEYKIPQPVYLAAAAYTPPLPEESGMSFPYLVTLAPLALLAIGSGGGGPTPPPPPPHPIAEPSGVVLLAIGIAAILITRKHKGAEFFTHRG